MTWDRYVEEVKAKKANLAVAHLEMEQAQLLLQMCEIRSPARGTIHVTPETDPALLPVLVEAPTLPAQLGFRWGTLFWGALGGLTVLGVGLGPHRQRLAQQRELDATGRHGLARPQVDLV